MKHIDLLQLLDKNSELIDRAYRQESIQNVDEELLESTLFIKINERYKLNKNYLNFADSILQRIDYSIIFGDYEKEYKELIKLKKRYLESKNDYYKKSIEQLIENLYEKFYNRDREIQILIVRLENDTSLEIDILLENATDILEKIYELIEANEQIGELFRHDLRGLHRSIDKLLQSISVSILEYIQNIDKYIDQINHFILQTQKRRLQNRQIIHLSNLILNEGCGVLDEYLSLSSHKLYFTHTRSQKNRIHVYPDDRDMYKLKKGLLDILEGVRVKPIKKVGSIKKQLHEKLDIVNIDTIINDLNLSKSEDVFIFVKEHKELLKYDEAVLVDEAFKIYLSLTTKEQMVFSKDFNHYNIKVARWV
ncbi:hypothetical protein JHD47_07495 [Sulfurimonas sp. SAG-AH-194-L11]|nr:hypothetical protein [Sulfurimonas sp. SAG-AH-194-L11]MDF1877662.1 hypothetical protein [Sulfurimonas sp. SAG-AH-194-L11]